MTGESLRLEFRRQVRERVLATAHEHTVERGWERVRVGEIAVDSGVSRPTLYREFGNKDGLGEALMTREAERFFAAIAEALSEHAEVPDAVAAATRLTLEEASDNPLLKAVLTGSRSGDAGLLPFLTSRSESIRESARALIATWLEQQRPDLLPTQIEETVDAVVRLVISHVVAPALDPVDVGQRVAHLVAALTRTRN
ncbi:TetR family transcriptional regulator [Actinomycetospora sp. C-140]